jgi:hypothetical protein
MSCWALVREPGGDLGGNVEGRSDRPVLERLIRPGLGDCWVRFVPVTPPCSKAFRTVRSRTPSVARSATAGTIGNRSLMSPVTFDDTAREAIGDEAVDSAFSDGQAMAGEAAVDYSIATLSSVSD